MRSFPLSDRSMLVKSEASLLRCLAVASVSLGALLCAYKLGKDLHRTDAARLSPQPRAIHFGLNTGQTIVGVKDTIRAMCFYIGNEETEVPEDK
jgi:hypothetical protein